MKWDYLIQDLYENFTFIPKGVKPGRLMTTEEKTKCIQNYGRWVQNQDWEKNKYYETTLEMLLQLNGAKGWELVQATRFVDDSEYVPASWRCIFKKPVDDQEHTD